jgi:hypothetical protein
MPNYDLSTPGAVAASAKLARKRADEEPNQSSYNAAWLHGYADALVDTAKQLELGLNAHKNQRRNCAYER